MQHYVLPNEFSCPVCECIMDAAKHTVGGRGPAHDDFCVCANCAEFLAYVVDSGGEYSLRRCTELDTAEAIKDGIWEEIKSFQLAIKTGELKLKVRWPK